MRTPPQRVTTPPARRSPRSLVRSPVSIHVTQEFFRSGIVKRETLPSHRRPSQVSPNSLRRPHVPNARRRDSPCQTRSCILQIQPVVRKIVELRYDPLIQAFLFFIEWLGLVILALGNAISQGRGRDWFRLARSQLVNNLPPMPQICCKEQPILAPPQCTIENTELLLISDPIIYLITSFPSLLECRSHFRKILTRTNDKISSPCTVHSEVAADESFSQLISPRRRGWACSVQRLAQLPNVCRPESSRYIIGQLNEDVSLLFSVEIRSSNVKHSYNNVLTLGSPARVCDHSFDQVTCL